MKPTPEFAIFQNSRTKQSAVWSANDKEGSWVDCKPEEYDTLALIAQLIRTSDNPKEVLAGIKIAAQEKEPPETNWDTEPGFFIPPEELDGLDSK